MSLFETFNQQSEAIMNRYLIAAIATISIALSAGGAFACQKLNSAGTQTKPIPDTQQSSPSDTSRNSG